MIPKSVTYFPPKLSCMVSLYPLPPMINVSKREQTSSNKGDQKEGEEFSTNGASDTFSNAVIQKEKFRPKNFTGKS